MHISIVTMNCLKSSYRKYKKVIVLLTETRTLMSVLTISTVKYFQDFENSSMNYCKIQCHNIIIRHCSFSLLINQIQITFASLIYCVEETWSTCEYSKFSKFGVLTFSC